jgi:hypothetical protein
MSHPEGRCWSSHKPSSVSHLNPPSQTLGSGSGRWSSIWDGRRRPPQAAYPRLPSSFLRKRSGLSVRVTPRRLFGLAPAGGYRATTVTSGAVGSYPTVSPLPSYRREPNSGGLFSVVLSVALRRPGVTWQPTLWSSDFPRGPYGTRDHRARPVVSI